MSGTVIHHNDTYAEDRDLAEAQAIGMERPWEADAWSVFKDLQARLEMINGDPHLTPQVIVDSLWNIEVYLLSRPTQRALDRVQERLIEPARRDVR